MRRPATTLVIVLAAIAGLASCRHDGDRDLPPYRCLGELSLDELIHGVGVPPSHPGDWQVNGHKVSHEGRVFDLEQQATVTLGEPSPFVASLCQRLRAQLAKSCEVQTFWPGVEHCAAVVQSPAKAITGPGGVYHHRAFRGRVNLFASPKPDGTVSLVLTGSEWAN